ncbi:putative ATP-binding component of dipeptide transport system [Marinomonas sp. MED121]|uniref:peptide ABC transporter ATP-binding protein n=1 Tax=Marinomonas sp. MED121 TaxID=314277 RepID=UPI000068FB9D|nr:peptide ABC transporter ATP-binding protein [Marinomonas sp. MED121]EAQ65067.1 putative ATP-binding component of dipeptide transport system [Marinomonas sp. MED121]
MSQLNTSAEVILKASELKQHYQVKQGLFKDDAVVKAVDGVSFTLEKGRTLAVVGESGCGKSTLGRMLTMIETPTAGEIDFEGADLLNLNKSEQEKLRQKIQIIFQNPYGSLNPRKKIGTILEEPLVINSKMGKAERKAKALNMMAKVGLKEEHYDRYPHMFSGGQRQRIAIARGLMLDPNIIVADEPVSALDVSVQAQVLNLMMDLQQEFGLSYVFVSHDLSVVEHIADEVIVMYLGKVVEQGKKEDIFNSPKHPYTQALLSSTPQLNADKRRTRIKLEGELPSPLNPPAGCAFHGRCMHANDKCNQVAPVLKAAENQMIACHAVEEGRLAEFI